MLVARGRLDVDALLDAPLARGVGRGEADHLHLAGDRTTETVSRHRQVSEHTHRVDTRGRWVTQRAQTDLVWEKTGPAACLL